MVVHALIPSTWQAPSECAIVRHPEGGGLVIFYRVGPRHQTEVIRLGHKYLYPKPSY